MPSRDERLYELAKDALDDQLRTVDERRDRAAPLIAAAAVAATLLTKPAFAGRHPDGFAEHASTFAGLAGILILVVSYAYLLWPREMRFSADHTTMQTELEVLDAAEVDRELAAAFSDRRTDNEQTVRRISNAFNVMLFGILLEVAGLGLAVALAS